MRSLSAQFRRRCTAVSTLAIICLFFFQSDPHARPLRKRAKAAHPLLVGYFPQWGLYYDQPYYVKQLVDNGSVALLDQINYAQGFVSNGKCSVADPNADLNTTYTAENSVSGEPDDPASPFRGYFHQLKELKKRYPRLKILISLEGAAAGFAHDAQAENRKAFVASCIDTFIRGNFAPGIHEPGIFDGFDVDWEYPQDADAANFTALLREFRKQMRAVRPGLRLSIAVGHSPHMHTGVDFAAIAPLVDQVGVMNYDYTGPWSHTTGFLAPLFSNPTDPHHPNSIETNIADYIAAGIPAGKLLMGVPFYGYGWTGVNQTNNGLYQSGHAVRGDQPYRYIRTLIENSSVYRDPRSQAPWLYDGQNFWTYEDAVSVRYKVSYAANQHLGGVMIWELSEDTADAILLNTASSALLNPIPATAFAAEPEEPANPSSSSPGGR
jgi:chitinase